MADLIKIEQALFGYQDGHHLIAASTSLSPTQRVLLATLTDSSGPESNENFSRSITGTPLPNSPFYALFCTWPAPEMRRPGCVWSHVLLIRIEDLARIHDLGALRPLFIRPASPPLTVDYEKSIDVSEFIRPTTMAPHHSARCKLLLEKLYEQPESGIVVLDSDNAHWEDPIFSVWSQQWPRLRRSFAFSTGSFADRRRASVSFDLQIAPLETARLWGRDSAPTHVTSLKDVKSDVELPWLITAIQDLSGKSHAVREFLFTYGGEVDSRRAAFIPLVDIYIKITLPSSLFDPLDALLTLGQSFPSPTAALSLKKTWIAKLLNGDEQGDAASDYAWALLYFLTFSELAPAFSKVQIDFAPFASLLWTRRRAELLSILGHPQNVLLTEEFTASLAEQLESSDIPDIWEHQPNALFSLLRFRPSLVWSSSAWEMPSEGQEALWSFLNSLELGPDFWSATLSPMIIARVDHFELQTVAACSDLLVEGLEDWTTSKSFGQISSTWKQVLKPNLTAALRTEGKLSARLLVFASSLAPREATGLDGSRKDILGLSKSELMQLPHALKEHAYFWITALGFKTNGSPGAALLSLGLFDTYEAVGRSHYSSSSWGMVEPLLPNSSWGYEWDRCKRLRAALKEWLSSSINMKYREKLESNAPNSNLSRMIRHL